METSVNNKCKAFTSLEQSKKLAEILPIESADMWWNYYSVTTDDTTPQIIRLDTPWVGSFNWYNEPGNIPCWSLSALLGVLPNNKHITTTLSRGGWKIDPVEYIDKWFCEYEDEVDEDSPCKAFTVSADNPVDACVAMIEHLHELKML